MIPAKYSIAAALMFCGGAVGFAQEPRGPEFTPAQKRLFGLLSNRTKLDITLHLDRDIYFPGEEPEIAIRVVNPTAETLEIPAPFEYRGGHVMFLRPGIGPYNEPE